MLCLCYQMRITKEYIIYLGNNKIFILLPSTSIITWFSKCEVCWKLFQSNFSWGEVRRLCKEMRNGFWQIWFFTYKISLSFCLLSYVNSVSFTWWRDNIRLSCGPKGRITFKTWEMASRIKQKWMIDCLGNYLTLTTSL